MNDFSKHAAKARLTKLASEAAQEYFGNDIPLNDSITEISKEENLTTEEVNRVCELANYDVYSNLFKVAEDKTFTFEIAESQAIIEGINKQAGINVRPPSNYKAIDVVYKDPGQEKVASANPFGDMKIFGKTGSMSTNHKQRLTIFLEKTAKLHGLFKEAKFRADTKREALVDRFLHDVKQMVITKQASFENIYHNLVDACPEGYQTTAKLLKMAALQMGKKLTLAAEHSKIAGVAVDPKLFKDGLSFSGRPLKVINGRQVLVMSLDTLIKQDAEYEQISKGLDITGDKVKYLREKLHNVVADEVQRGGE